ncbi:MAG TPA: M20/M25/M40 family metallo-hydrolase, partial [Nitrososphaerales archaeon]|nr:M20/M25/M40 family metallo-hydrolase [Nitrososphaerales archaeon]
MVSQNFEKYVKDNLDGFAKEVIRLASQRSVSARNEGVEECSVLVEKMLKEIGATTKVLKLDGVAPLVYGEMKSKKGGKTVMFYNHYDVQPEEPLELWKSPPFKPEIRDGAIYGRGVSDDKGELVSRLKLVEAFLKADGDIPCNVKFCFEGEEEVGSPHLEEYVNRYPDLFKSDAVIWEYGKIGSDGTPVVGLGVKGMIYLELTV